MKRFILLCIILCLSVCVCRFSFADEGVSPIAESRYFSVYAFSGMDASALLGKLNFNFFLQPETIAGSKGERGKSSLERTLDALYAQVSDVMDIHVYSFHGTIKIYPDSDYVRALYQRLTGVRYHERSFYHYEKNTIYISYSDLNLGMLGHEIAHAIISSFFVVPPPPKVQEILCGYVEYSLRKSTGTLR